MLVYGILPLQKLKTITSLKIILTFSLQVLFWLLDWWLSTASDHTPTSLGLATWTLEPVFWPRWQLPFSYGTSFIGVRTAWRPGSLSLAVPWPLGFAVAWKTTMLSHRAERADLKGERSPRRYALELFSINIYYNLKLRVERHQKAHSCGQRPSIIIWMGSIYIHMYKTHNFYIYYIALSLCCTAKNVGLSESWQSITATCQQGQL